MNSNTMKNISQCLATLSLILMVYTQIQPQETQALEKRNVTLAYLEVLCYNGLNCKDLYGNATDLYKMVEINFVLSIKSIYPVASCILCHLPAFQVDSK